MVVYLCKDLLIYLILFTPNQGHHRLALQPGRRLNAKILAEGREYVDMRYHGIAYAPTAETAGAAHDQHDADAVVGKIALHSWHGQSVVRCTDDEGILG